MLLGSPLPIANLGETGKSCEWVQAVGKTRERPSLKSHKAIPTVKITQKQRWFDLSAARGPPDKIGQTVETFKTSAAVRTCPIAPLIPDGPPAPAEASRDTALFGLRACHTPGKGRGPRSPPGEGHRGVIRGLTLSSLVIGPQK